MLISGSVLALLWSAVPERIFHEARESPVLVGVAAAYPIADLILVTMAVLLAADPAVDSPAGRAGRCACSRPAMLAFGVTDTLRLLDLTGGGAERRWSRPATCSARPCSRSAALSPPRPAGRAAR